MGAKYSYGVWERFARQANTILRTCKKHPTSRSVNICFKCSDLGTLLTGGWVINKRWGLIKYFKGDSYSILASIDPPTPPHSEGGIGAWGGRSRVCEASSK